MNTAHAHTSKPQPVWRCYRASQNPGVGSVPLEMKIYWHESTTLHVVIPLVHVPIFNLGGVRDWRKILRGSIASRTLSNPMGFERQKWMYMDLWGRPPGSKSWETNGVLERNILEDENVLEENVLEVVKEEWAISPLNICSFISPQGKISKIKQEIKIKQRFP